MPVGSTLPFTLLSMALAVGLAQAQGPSPETAQGLGTLREALSEATYGVERRGGTALEAHNAAQGLRFAFEEGGVEVSAVDEAGGAWNARLTVAAVGRSGAMLSVEPALPFASGRRVEYRRGPLTEWYVNDERGLEQGFVVGERPAGEGALEVAMALDSGLAVEVTPSGRDALLTHGATGRVLHYSGLRAWDAVGCELEASLAVEGHRLSIRVADERAIYPVHIDPWIATEEAKLLASDPTQHDEFGSAVAIEGDTALIGAPWAPGPHFDSGSAYVFVRSGTSWSEQAKLKASSPSTEDHFGGSVALSGNTAAIGAPEEPAVPGFALAQGAVYIFVRNGTTWTEQQRLVAGDAVLYAHFGRSVALSGDTVVVGAAGSSLHAPGAAYVFVRNGAIWSEQQKLTGSDTGLNDFFGSSVALSGNTALIGSTNDSAYVFVRSGMNWSEQQKLTASDGGDAFGWNVALEGDTAVIGAWADDPSGKNRAGSAYVFTRSGNNWSEQQKLTASVPEEDAFFGDAVAVAGDLAVIGAYHADHAGGNSAGSAYLFARSGTVWRELQELTASDAEPLQFFGAAVSLSGDSVVVGASGDDQANAFNTGAAYVFRLSPDPVSYCTAGTSASGCQALISATGTPSASAPSGFALHASAVEGEVDGLFFWGTSGRQASPWGNGTSFQCVVPPLLRGAMQAGGGTSGACDGSFTLDLNALWCSTCPKSHKNPGAGTVVQGQLWYVDPLSTSNQPTSLSDAIEFGVGP